MKLDNFIEWLQSFKKQSIDDNEYEISIQPLQKENNYLVEIKGIKNELPRS